MVGEDHDGTNHHVHAREFGFQGVVQEVCPQSEPGVVDEKVNGRKIHLLDVSGASHVEA